jgi:raffinose/stachyose/melibiose transport system substrate-binding protein
MSIKFALATCALPAAAGAQAQTVVRWLHIEAHSVAAAACGLVARDLEARDPGVKVAVQILENEAYKAKLTTLLQSMDEPDINGWRSGELHAQVKACVAADEWPASWA